MKRKAKNVSNSIIPHSNCSTLTANAPDFTFEIIFFYTRSHYTSYILWITDKLFSFNIINLFAKEYSVMVMLGHIIQYYIAMYTLFNLIFSLLIGFNYNIFSKFKKDIKIFSILHF